MMPLYLNGAFEYPTAIALATLIGFGFGFVLERAGFGRATILSAQFYGANMRVLKVMFTAIATAAVGLGLLGGVGLVDLSMLSIPETFLWPQLVGGLLFGVGFVVSGYCPGTSIVAATSGNVDALYTLGGIVIGSVAFGFAYPALESFYLSGDMGVVTFDQLLGVSWVWLAAGVAIMAFGAFLGAEKVESWLAGRSKTEAPDHDMPLRNRAFVGLGVAALLGIATLGLPQKTEEITVDVDLISNMDLAESLILAHNDLYLIDLRNPSECASKRIPGAMCLPGDDVEGRFIETLPPTRTLVLYSNEVMTELPNPAKGYKGPVAVLDGTFNSFQSDVLDVPKLPTDPTVENLEEYRLKNALHQQFTGQKTAPVDLKPKATSRAVKKGGGC
ncbi:MAG: hypothetical protein CO108_03235 [Deltaproteobacteria bacterium CG_4_9_14_3_um_filter_63_12]|nr:MAG: hypothetical protein CO108_03235 [Deltaproteobacteria bacterium CG_4_9_14_3_um_filter_63_12]